VFFIERIKKSYHFRVNSIALLRSLWPPVVAGVGTNQLRLLRQHPTAAGEHSFQCIQVREPAVRHALSIQQEAVSIVLKMFLSEQ
jgi:hypothetical protein